MAHNTLKTLSLALACSLATAAYAQSPAHPMDALTADEIRATRRILEESGRLADAAFFPAITLQENDKASVLAWRAGMPFTRQAFAVVFQDSAVFETVVDLDNANVVSWQEIPDIEPRILGHEFDVVPILWQDARWRDAMALRGYDSAEDVFCMPLTTGPVLPAEYAGHRLLYANCLDVTEENLMAFGRPISGLMGIVDLESREVLDVIDLGVIPQTTDRPSLDYELSSRYRTDAKPVEIVAPEGSNITIDGSEITWDNWRFHLRTDQRVGPVISLVTYDDEGERRPIAYQMAASEMFVPYMDPTPTWSWRAYMDIGEYGFGLSLSPLVAGADCPASAHFLNQVIADDSGAPLVLENSVCIFERPTGGPLWRHVENGALVSRPAVELVVRMAPVVGNYDYLIDFAFSKAGDIDIRAGAAGIDAVKAVAAQSLADLSAEEDTAYGTMIGSGLVGVNHDHFIAFRVDLDIDGPVNSARFDHVRTQQLPEDNLRRSLWTVEEETVTQEGALAQHLGEGYLRIISDERTNRLGYATGYQLYPGHNALSILAPDEPLQERAAWSAKPAWLTRYAGDELYASGDYPNQNPAVTGLAQWAGDGDSIEKEDLVLWYTLGFRHITRAEDWPGMPTLWHSFRLRPFNFFGGSPVMDVVPETE